jgi:tetratricopeptide (TPR) repeat protein
MYLGNIAASNGNDNEAINYYEDLISNNRKYFEAYVALSKLYSDKDIMKARTLLRDCLTINPEFLPAIVALADSYRKSSPDVAKKYDELANTIKKN